MKFGVGLSLSLLAAMLVSFAAYRYRVYEWPQNGDQVTPAMLDEARHNSRVKNKTLMVEFGARWCSDCLMLSKSLEEGPERGVLGTYIEVFKVDVGEFNRNLDIAKRLGVDLSAGIPAAVFFPPDNGPPLAVRGIEEVLHHIDQLISGQAIRDAARQQPQHKMSNR